MDRIFLSIYNFFEQRRSLLWMSLVVFVVLLGFSASRLNVEQDIMKILPDKGNNAVQKLVFEKLKVKDNVVVMVSAKDGNIASVHKCALALEKELNEALVPELAQSVDFSVDPDAAQSTSDIIYSNLPIYIDNSVYSAFDSIFSADAIDRKMAANYESLHGLFGNFAADYIYKDPFGLASPALKSLANTRVSSKYSIIDGGVYLSTDSTAIVTITPTFPAGDVNASQRLTEILEKVVSGHEEAKIDCFGGPVMGVYNSRCIQKDMRLTIIVGILAICMIIFFSFRDRKSVFLILLPSSFGFLFSMAVMALFKDSISLIAMGASSAIMGVVMSYAIHVVTHKEHCKDAQQLIKELSSPLTIGSLTTIGAFFSLTFTSSSLLVDFGLLASNMIIGAMIFCLVYLPHIMSYGETGEKRRLLQWIESVNAYKIENVSFLVVVILLLSGYGLYHYNDVDFDADMNHLCYYPEGTLDVEKKLQSSTCEDGEVSIYFVSAGSTDEEALVSYHKMNHTLDSLLGAGDIVRHSHLDKLLVSGKEQQEKIEKWNSFWTDARKRNVEQQLKKSAEKYGFEPSAFEPFIKIVNAEYKSDGVLSAFEKVPKSPLSKHIDSWFCSEDGMKMAISNVVMKSEAKQKVYDSFVGSKNVVILDKPHFVQGYMRSVQDDFNFVLGVSSLIVFLGLLLNYGRLETALLSFMPMALAWLIILGVMHIFGLSFNIVSVIISTFIFGIGDDFSIFITDGLVDEYSRGRHTLLSHKIAIFFSSVVSILGMGVLVFADHPSLLTVAYTSLIGMFATVLIAYVLQPLIFRMFVTRRTEKGLSPITINSLFWTILLIGSFGIAGILLSLIAMLSYCLPLKKIWRYNLLHYLICYFCRGLLWIATPRLTRKDADNTHEDFTKPAMIIANHQSVLDIVRVMALTPKVVIMAKKTNWNSPVYGILLHLSGFFCSDDATEDYIPQLKSLVANGYSICVFPEGERSVDGKITKFHPGAFFLASELGIDILPVVFAGHHYGIRKGDIIYVGRTNIAMKVCERRACAPSDRAKRLFKEDAAEYEAMIKKEYDELCRDIDTPKNPYFRHLLEQNFILKGPVLEYYTKVKIRLENDYLKYWQQIPDNSVVSDLGCGYGYLSFMLSHTLPGAEIHSYDYDEDKIEIAQHCYSVSSNQTYSVGDIVSADFVESDVFILNDVLHYMTSEDRERVLCKCLEKLKEGGKIIVRDADKSQEKTHKITKLTEWFSTSSVIHFNKVSRNINFFDAEEMKTFAENNGLDIEITDNDEKTSNKIFVLRRGQKSA